MEVFNQWRDKAVENKESRAGMVKKVRKVAIRDFLYYLPVMGRIIIEKASVKYQVGLRQNNKNNRS